jgi:DNA-binding Xre family transcriptional regulator
LSMSEKIKIVLIKRKMAITTLAKKLGTSPQNLSGKLTRDNFSERELREIAAALDCTLNTSFIMNDTGEKV